MNKNELFKVLEDWNFWTKEQKTGILRKKYLPKLESLIRTNFIIFITGSRRSGKSFIMLQMARKFIENGQDPKNILYVNLEDYAFPSQLDVSFLDEIYNTYCEYIVPDKFPTIFLDEIQEIKGFEKWLRKFHELGKARIIVSGSNAHLLSKELGTVLTGRHLDLTVFPLSFSEFLMFNGLEIKNLEDVVSREVEIKQWFHRYLENGAFPEVVLKEEKREILNQYFDDIVTKDLLKRYKIRKAEDLRALVRFYISNIGSLTTFKAITRSLKLSITTVKNYSNYLEEVYLLFMVKRFDYKTREQDKSPRKVYSIDTGLCNTVGFRFTENLGKLAENAVFLSLKRKQSVSPMMEIYYWKDEHHREVDFLIKDGLKVTELIQVCWDIDNEKTKNRELRSLLKAMREFEIKNSVVVTGEHEGTETIEDKLIEYVPLWKWLLVNEASVEVVA